MEQLRGYYIYITFCELNHNINIFLKLRDFEPPDDDYDDDEDIDDDVDDDDDDNNNNNDDVDDCV